MAEVFSSNETTVELLNPITGATLYTATFTRDLSLSERPVYVERAFARSGAVTAHKLRSKGSITLRKDSESLDLVRELKRWQQGVTYYALSSDLRGKTYRHPNLRLTMTNADGTVERQVAYGVRLSDRTLSRPDGSVLGDSISLDVLRGFDLSATEAADSGRQMRALDFARPGQATYINSAGSLTTATDGVARIGVPYGTYSATKAGLILESSFTNSLTSPDAPATQTVSLTAGTYTAYLDGTGSVAISGGPTGTVTASAPVTFTLGSTTSVTFTVSGTVTRFGCVNLPFRPSHISGTKQADVCGIVSPHNLLKYSEQFDNAAWVKGDGTNRITVTANAAAGPFDTGSATTAERIDLASGVATGGTPDDVVQSVSGASLTRTFSIWMRAVSGTVVIRPIFQGAGAGSTITLDTNWQRVPFTNSAANPIVGFDFNNSTGTASIYVWGGQLTEGSHPGIYCRTTDTAIPKPADGGLDPAWVQNGRIAFRAVTPFAYLKKIAYFGCPLNEGPVSASQLGIGRVSTDTSGTYQVYACRQHNGSTGTNGVAGSAYAGSGNIDVWDNAAHDWIIEWTNYTLNGVQYMYLRLYVDSVLKVELNAAALFGATAWATIDPSKLISDGNTFSVISNLTLGFPSLPAGAIPA